MDSVYMSIPHIPPSVNEMYKSVRQGRKSWRALTKVGETFERRFMSHISSTYMAQLKEISEAAKSPNIVFGVYITVYFESLVTAGWPKRAKNRYKVLDADNREKIALDVTKRAIGTIDDNLFFTVLVEKRQGLPQRTEVHIEALPCSQYGIEEVPWSE